MRKELPRVVTELGFYQWLKLNANSTPANFDITTLLAKLGRNFNLDVFFVPSSTPDPKNRKIFRLTVMAYFKLYRIFDA